MKKVSSISKTGLVLFVDDEKRGQTTLGTEQDCLDYAFKYQSGECYAFVLNNKPTYERRLSTGNKVNQKNTVLGEANNVISGKHSLVAGKGHTVSLNGSYSAIKGKNGYSENYGENVYSVSKTKNRARYLELHYVGGTDDDVQKELFIGGQNNQKFYPNSNYATCYFIETYTTALRYDNQEIWTQQGYHAYRNSLGTFVEVGHHSVITLKDSGLNYDVDLAPNGDYLSVLVTGDTGNNVIWNVVLQITEVRIEENFSANLIQNGDFSEIGDELVNILNASGSLTMWINRTEFGADFVGGTTTAVRYLSDITSAITTNKIYRISVDVENYVGSNTTGVSSFGRSTTIGTPYRSSSGNILIYTKSSDGSRFRYYGRENSHTFDLRNVSVKQLDPNNRWIIDSPSATNGWFFYDNRIQGISNGTTNYLQQDFGAKIGSRYQIKYTVLTSTINDVIFLSTNSVFGTTALDKTVGTHTLILEATNNTTKLYDLMFVLVDRNTSGIIELTDISVKELTYGV